MNTPVTFQRSKWRRHSLSRVQQKERGSTVSRNALLTEQRSSWGGGAVSLVAGQGRFFFSPELRDSNWNVHLPLFLPLMLVGGLGCAIVLFLLSKQV